MSEPRILGQIEEQLHEIARLLRVALKDERGAVACMCAWGHVGAAARALPHPPGEKASDD